MQRIALEDKDFFGPGTDLGQRESADFPISSGI
jgi:hypothetical protein